jgi:translation elongation factor EF-G
MKQRPSGTRIWKNSDAMLRAAHSDSANYRETIQQSAIGDRKYIRFFSGRGHFAHLRLQLIPCPGEPCLVTKSERLEIPAECYEAARASIVSKLESGPIHGYPMFGLEVRMIGGTFLAKYSSPEAFARAASMAFDEAVFGASPVAIERCCGIRLKVDLDAIRETLETLTGFLGEVPATISLNSLQQYFVVQVEAPVRLLAGIRRKFALQWLETYPLPRAQQYRVMTGFPSKGQQQGSPLDDWT